MKVGDFPHSHQLSLENALTTKFDDKLAYILLTSLSNYENERITGQTFATDEFASGIKSTVPNGHQFTAFPLQFTTKDAGKIFARLQHLEVLLLKGFR